VLAIAFGLFLKAVRIQPVRATIFTIATFCLALNLIGTINIGNMTPELWQRMAQLPVEKRSAAELGLYTGPNFELALQRIPAGEPIGYYNRGDGFVYPLYDADFSRTIRFIPITPDNDFVQNMRDRGVRFLFVFKPGLAIEQRIEAAVREGELHKLGEDRRRRRVLAGLYVTSKK